jgi:glutamate 5-kinase
MLTTIPEKTEMKNREVKDKGLVYRRIVVKLGTSLLTGSSNYLNEAAMNGLVGQIARLHEQGAEIIIVSSGAIAAGRDKLGLTKNIRGIPFKQVLASVGQSRLMNIYERLFDRHNITVAQALLTKADLSDRAGYLNARNTLMALLDLNVIGIVNENDVVSIDEIKEAKFGDNDNLSAMVANLVDADVLMILSDIDGLYTADPNRDPKARIIPQVSKIDAGIKRLGTNTNNKLSTGGMITKIEAAQIATTSGVHVVIANGRETDVILRLAAGESIGTHFLPTSKDLESRERWMLSGLCVRGKVIIDAGAAMALKKQNRSLLAAGIQQVDGKFSRGDIVSIDDKEGIHLGYGITNYSSSDIHTIKGAQSNKIASLLSFDYGPEVVHRNNLTLLEREEPSADRETLPLHQ